MKKTNSSFSIFTLFILFGIISCGEDETVNQPPPTPTETVWKAKISMPTARWGHSAILVDGKIYVIGGSNTTGWNAAAVSTVEVYDPSNNSWDVNKAPLPTARVHMSSCELSGKIYLIGGRPSWGRDPKGNVEVYDPATDTWDTSKEPMPMPRAGGGCCAINDKIYIVGGTSGSATYYPHNNLQIYDPITDSWDTTKASLPYNVGGLYSCSIDEKFYVIGGAESYPYAGKRNVMEYNTVSNTWSSKALLNEGRRGHTLSVLNGMIYAFGGAGATTTSVRSVEVYDPAVNSWTTIEETPIWHCLHSSTVYQNKIYLIGGSETGVHWGDFTPTKKVYSFDPSLIE
jgi:N-acetylneuraminic acid mutarotase